MRINVELLNKVKRHILENPRRLNMNYVIARKGEKEVQLHPSNFSRRWPSCGTVGCIAGWTVLLKDGMDFAGDAQSRAQELLGITSSQANELFYPEGLLQCRATVKDARTIAKHIDEFIESAQP